jgi:hypothetical protein
MLELELGGVFFFLFPFLPPALAFSPLVRCCNPRAGRVSRAHELLRVALLGCYVLWCVLRIVVLCYTGVMLMLCFALRCFALLYSVMLCYVQIAAWISPCIRLNPLSSLYKLVEGDFDLLSALAAGYHPRVSHSFF